MNTPSSPQLVRTGLFQRLKGTGLERFELLRAPEGWVLRGTILALEEDGPAQADYEIVCDTGWRTNRVEVSLRQGSTERSLRLTVEDGRWYEDGKEQETVRGCIDIDLGWSPSTNTLPIRRLGLAVGEKSGPVTAAWVRFPELTLEPLPQEYERLAERRYRYSSNGGAFVADLEVDQDGLVVDYEGIWRRESDPLSPKFEGLLEHMQTPTARKGMKEAFNASPAALGRAVAKAARRRR
jgi:uncharacterized protein